MVLLAGCAAPQPAAPPTTPATSSTPAPPSWRTVSSPEDGAAYDVPAADWRIEREDSPIYDPAKGTHAASFYVPEGCERVSPGEADFLPSDRPDLEVLAADAAYGWAEGQLRALGGSGNFRKSGSEPFPLVGGTITGYRSTVTVNWDKTPTRCTGPQLIVTAVAFTKPGGGTGVFVFNYPAGSQVDLPADTVQRIVSSVRPL
ncbi:hypothetical protein D5S17_11210 [Pseudonocardiaceae bacterium YIM PH 21723]|nr:hypothetical protein D5S17_11210 [Pseudonocardiaceae bacterium YIM PH 21723]